ncbi:MAG: hypothetical protein R3F59_16415 [Myxococcota bacterium]
MLLLLAPARAQAPEIVWARPFTLAQPETWTMTASPRPFTEGLLVELRVDPAVAELREGRAPALFLGGEPLFRFNGDRVGGCVVGFVPGPVDLAAAPVFVGPATLPERLQADEADNAARGRPALPVGDVKAALAAGGAPLRAADLRDVQREAMARVAACSATPEDHQRAD